MRGRPAGAGKKPRLLLEAFRRIHAERPVALIILGDGPERAALEAQIAAGLSDAVRLLGHRDNVYPYLRRADVFIHTCPVRGLRLHPARSAGL